MSMFTQRESRIINESWPGPIGLRAMAREARRTSYALCLPKPGTEGKQASQRRRTKGMNVVDDGMMDWQTERRVVFTTEDDNEEGAVATTTLTATTIRW